MEKVKICRAMIALVATLLVLPATAEAACVQGTLYTWWEVGGYCDRNLRTCTEWNYTNLSQNTYQPIREMKVEVVNEAGTSVLATGNTNSLGQYNICYAGSPTAVRVRLKLAHLSDAFSIRQSNGGTWFTDCAQSGLGSGTNLRNCYWGSNNAPHLHVSLYEQAYISLKNAVNEMDGVRSGFTNAQIRMNAGSSNTYGYDKIVNIANGHELNWVVAHEIGHVLSHMGSRDRYLGTDSSNKGPGVQYDACGGNDGTTWTSVDECRDAVWTESIAQLFATWSLQSASATNPCTASGLAEMECLSGGGFDLEATPACAARMRIQDSLRYMWDHFDTPANTVGDNTTIAKDTWDAILNRYPGGRANRAKDENWCCTFWSCWSCDHDDKNLVDWESHVDAQVGVDTAALRSVNCSN
jgi:hypothetical protein